MNAPPNLQALQRGEREAWDEAFRCLWPTAFAVAKLRLQPFLPQDVEDVAIEALEELVEQVRVLKHVEELKPLVASIAHNRAVSRLRRHFAAKREGGKTVSLEERQDAAGDEPPEAMAADSPVAALDQKELAERLRQLLVALKPPLGDMLADAFLRGLSHDQIAQRHNLAKGSVGVYLKRGLEALRKTWGGEAKWL